MDRIVIIQVFKVGRVRLVPDRSLKYILFDSIDPLLAIFFTRKIQITPTTSTFRPLVFNFKHYLSIRFSSIV